MSSPNKYSSSLGNDKKLHVIGMKLKMIWPKFDKDSKLVIFEKTVIAKAIQNFFTEAMLKSDYDSLVKIQPRQSLDKLIYEEAQIFDFEKVMRDQKGTDLSIALNQ
jgi:hypothetical protein